MQKEKFNKLPTYKIILLGACSVGKTCMINQFVNNYFYMRDEETNEDLRYKLTETIPNIFKENT